MAQRKSSKQNDNIVMSLKRIKFVFWFNAFEKILRSIIMNISCGVIGFLFGVGVVIGTIHIKVFSSAQTSSIDELSTLMSERQALDLRINRCFNDAVLKQLNCQDGKLIYNKKIFSIEQEK